MFPSLPLVLCAVLFSWFPWVPAGAALVVGLVGWFCFLPPGGF